MKLYKLLNINWRTFFGTDDNPIERDVVLVAQSPSEDSLLYLSKDTHNSLELLNTVPGGFVFTYCQEWGLTINDAVIDRVIIDLRKKAYPTIEDQLDMQYWDIVDDTITWKTAIDTVKANYPKR
jgi:hypothetical protein